MATYKLLFISESRLARLYRHEKGVQQWVPKSVTPDVSMSGMVHEVKILDWWVEQNPWVKKPQAQQELL